MTIIHEHPIWKYGLLALLCGMAIWYATACVPMTAHAQQPPIAGPIPPPVVVISPPTVIMVPGQLPIYIR